MATVSSTGLLRKCIASRPLLDKLTVLHKHHSLSGDEQRVTPESVNCATQLKIHLAYDGATSSCTLTIRTWAVGTQLPLHSPAGADVSVSVRQKSTESLVVTGFLKFCCLRESTDD